MNSIVWVYVKLFIAMFFWGLVFILGAKITQSVDVVSAVFWRFVIALVALFFFLKGKVKIANLTLKRVVLIIFAAFMGFYFYNVFFMLALQNLNPVKVAAIVPTNPVIIAIIAALFLKESLSLLNLAGCFLSFAGAILTLTNGDFAAFFSFGVHELYCVLAICSWVIFVFSLKFLTSHYDTLQLNFWFFLIACAMIFATNSNQIIVAAVNITPTIWLFLAFLGVFPTALSYIWYGQAVKVLGAARSSSFISLIPALVAFQSFALFNTALTIYEIIGAICVTLGVYMVQIKARVIQAPVT